MQFLPSFNTTCYKSICVFYPNIDHWRMNKKTSWAIIPIISYVRNHDYGHSSFFPLSLIALDKKMHVLLSSVNLKGDYMAEDCRWKQLYYSYSLEFCLLKAYYVPWSVIAPMADMAGFWLWEVDSDMTYKKVHHGDTSAPMPHNSFVPDHSSLLVAPLH